MKNKELSLYIHIPFCIRKCHYCDFLSFPCENGCQYDIEAYVDKLCQELEYSRKKYKEYSIYSVFIGGGTPSILTNNQISKIMKKVRLFLSESENKPVSHEIDLREEAVEITLEVNPGTVTKEKAACWMANGINRLSIGLQSTDNDELRLLGRIHTYEEFLESWKIITDIGFSNRNIDLISGLPGQSKEAFEKNLSRVLELNPEHISSYSLQLEAGTRFGKLYTEDDLPSEELDRYMYYLTKEKLENSGFHRYEISNYSKKGFESRHNKVYWKRGNYLGLGLGASSLVENTRFTNTENMIKYLSWDFESDIYEDSPHVLSVEEQMEEFVFLGLRLTEGIDIEAFNIEFDSNFFDVYGEVVEAYIQSGHLILEDNILRLTDKGIDVSNIVLSDFLID